MNNKKMKKSLHPIMTFLILICIVIVVSGVLYLLDFSQTLYTINQTPLEYSVSTVTVQNLFSFEGLKYIFSSTVANFVSFAPLSTLIIVLMGFGVMEKSGFLKTAITALTKKMKRNTVTFLLIFISIITSVFGDLSYIILLPLSALVFKYGKRNPLIGVVATFAGLTCGQGLSVIFTSVDSSLLSLSLTAARVIDMGYRMASISAVFIMAVAVLVLTYVLTMITEKSVAPKLNKYEVAETLEEETIMTRRELRENVFKMLFRVEFFDAGELPEQLELFGEEVDHVTDQEFKYIAERYRDIYNHLPEIDGAINEVAKGWKTTRMGKVDLALIRLAVYEIRYDDEIPFKVAVNEAVELAKQYGTNDSPAFVNGILAKFAE